MRKTLFILVLLLICVTMRAQQSGIELMDFESSYIADSTIVRNYNDTFSIVMSYGHYENIPAIDGLLNSSSFILRNNTNSSLTHIVSLPIGYQVNDVRFVSLTRRQGGEDWYCCFCGTRYVYRDMYAVIDSNGNPTNNYYYVYDSIGFVGFFWMKEALLPNTSCTAKLRDVEEANKLFRMTCYAEYQGAFYNMQSTYEDNAVLDIVGIPNLEVGTASAFWRVKFYPVYPPVFQPSGTRWDNNIRYDIMGIEKMIDVTQTGNRVVTVSKNIEDGNQLWLRFSGKETVWTYNGMELSSLIHPLKMNTLYIGGELLPEGNLSVVETPRVCDVLNEEFAVAFRMQNTLAEQEGLLTFRHNLVNGTGPTTINGLFNDGDFMLDDLSYMFWHDVTATLQRYRGSRAHITDANYWMATMDPYNLCRRFSVNGINLQSLCFYRRTVGDVMLWSGVDAVTLKPPYMLYQVVPSPKEMFTSCLEYENILSTQSKIDMGEESYSFPIRERFYDEWEEYPVIFRYFDPYEINVKTLCKKKE